MTKTNAIKDVKHKSVLVFKNSNSVWYDCTSYTTHFFDKKSLLFLDVDPENFYFPDFDGSAFDINKFFRKAKTVPKNTNMKELGNPNVSFKVCYKSLYNGYN